MLSAQGFTAEQILELLVQNYEKQACVSATDFVICFMFGAPLVCVITYLSYWLLCRAPSGEKSDEV